MGDLDVLNSPLIPLLRRSVCLVFGKSRRFRSGWCAVQEQRWLGCALSLLSGRLCVLCLLFCVCVQLCISAASDNQPSVLSKRESTGMLAVANYRTCAVHRKLGELSWTGLFALVVDCSSESSVLLRRSSVLWTTRWMRWNIRVHTSAAANDQHPASLLRQGGGDVSRC